MKRYLIVILACACLPAYGEDIKALLEKNLKIYEQQIARIDADRQKALDAWPAQYVQSLKALEQRLQKAGDLEGLMVVRKEQTRFANAKQIPQDAVVETPEELRDLQTTTMSIPETIEADRTARTAKVAGKYIALLEDLKKSLTRKGQVDQAIVVNSEIDTLKARPEMATLPPVDEGEASPTTDGSDMASTAPGQGKKGIPKELREGLVLHYPFDKDDSGKAIDKSKEGNTAPVQGAKWVTKGKIGGGFSFDGVQNKILVPDAPSLRVSNLTIALWIYRTKNDGKREGLVDKWFNGSQKSYTLVLADSTPSDTGYKPSFWISNSGQDQTLLTAPDDTPYKKWAFLTATYDGTTMRLYVDAKEVASSNERRGPIQQNNAPICIGTMYQDGVGTASRFEGTMDEVMIFNRALSARDIERLYKAMK